MATVAQVLDAKLDKSFHTIDASASVFSAVKSMALKRIGALVVTQGAEVCGIVTERDYARKVILLDKSSRNTPVHDIMSRAVRYVRSSQTSDECMALMTEHRIRHLPVIDGGVLVGVISIGDLVKSVIAEQQFAIDQLEIYVQGARSEPVRRCRSESRVIALGLA
jgi:CBS-domain-containing membrane protein